MQKLSHTSGRLPQFDIKLSPLTRLRVLVAPEGVTELDFVKVFTYVFLAVLEHFPPYPPLLHKVEAVATGYVLSTKRFFQVVLPSLIEQVTFRLVSITKYFMSHQRPRHA